MKLLLIKIGKAFGVLKRDGVIRGGKRVIVYGFNFLKMLVKIDSGDVLFLTGGVGDSAYYRTKNVAEELSIHGFKCSVNVQDNPRLPKYADKFKIFIFHRVLFTSNVEKLIERIKQQGKEIIFETDDLVFDPEYLKSVDHIKEMNALEKKMYVSGVGSEILDDPYVKTCTTTTSYLAGKLKEKGKRVFIVPNKLSNKDLEIVDKVLKHRKLQTTSYKLQTVKIGYFSGTISHNKDFATITTPLVQILKKHPNVKLLLAGPLDLNIKSDLNEFKDRIEQLPYVPRREYFGNVAQADINIAPLEVGDPFCESKSELKFFELGILGIPTVAVANQTFSEAISDGVDGFLAGNAEEWAEKLDKLITDENLRREMGQKAKEKSLQRYTNKNSHSGEYYDYLRSKLK